MRSADGVYVRVYLEEDHKLDCRAEQLGNAPDNLPHMNTPNLVNQQHLRRPPVLCWRYTPTAKGAEDGVVSGCERESLVRSLSEAVGSRGDEHRVFVEIIDGRALRGSRHILWAVCAS